MSQIGDPQRQRAQPTIWPSLNSTLLVRSMIALQPSHCSAPCSERSREVDRAVERFAVSVSVFFVVLVMTGIRGIDRATYPDRGLLHPGRDCRPSRYMTNVPWTND